MKKLLSLLALACGLAAWSVEYKLSVATDRPEALYAVGETAIFRAVPTVDGEPSDQGEVIFTVNNDRNNRHEEIFRFWLPDDTKVAYTHDRPGFIFCRVVWLVDGQEVAAETAAGFSPELIRQGMPEPAGFDEFWAAGKREAERVRLDAGDDYARVTPAPELATATLEVWRVNFANVDGKRLWGFLSIPKQGDGPFPAVVVIPGAGPALAAPGIHNLEGVISLVINVHDYDPAGGHQGPADYPMIGMRDRDANFFRRAWLGMDQATEWLRQHPKFDGKNLGVCGQSQGGGSTLALAGLNEHFTFAVAHQPALCDFGAELQGRQPGWPSYAHRFRHDQEVLDQVAYIDCANLARRIECPIIVLAGFVDAACPPGTVYAAFNNIPFPGKTMIGEPDTNHIWSNAYSQARETMVKALLDQ